MPFITICGTPDDVTQEDLEKLMQQVISAANRLANMSYREEDIMVWFPPDRMAKGLGQEFSIDVVALNSPWQRSDDYSNMIARQFCRVVADFFPKYRHIECSVGRFKGHDEGYGVLTRPSPP